MPFPFQPAVRIIDAAVQTFRVVAHWIRHAQRHELAVHQRQHSLGQIAGRKRHVLADTQHVEPIDEVIVRRVGAAVLHRSLVIRTRERIERPAFRAVLPSRGGRAVERALALAAVEAGVMSAREHRPDDALAVDVHAARRETLHRRLRVVPRHLVVLGQRSLGRVRSRGETNQRARHSQDRSPDRAVRRRRVAVVRHIDSFVLGFIRRLIRFRVGVAFPVSVVIQDERAPTLGFLLVVRLVPDPGVEPALNAGRPERRPQHIVVVHIHVAPGEAGVDRRRLFGFRFVELQPPLALSYRHQLRRRIFRSPLTPCRRVGLTDPRRSPYAGLLIHREAVDRRLAVPDHFVAPVGRGR